MNGLVGGPLLVGCLQGPGPPAPLKSGPGSIALFQNIPSSGGIVIFTDLFLLTYFLQCCWLGGW